MEATGRARVGDLATKRDAEPTRNYPFGFFSRNLGCSRRIVCGVGARLAGLDSPPRAAAAGRDFQVGQGRGSQFCPGFAV